MSLKTVIFDAAPSQRRVDENGFMHVDSCHVTKEQVVKYYGREIPGWRELGLDPERLYNVYRPGDEIEKAAATFDGLPLQLQHHIDSADEPQTEFRVGSISRPVWRAPYLDCDLHITNGAAISAVEHGDFKEISAAYLYEPVIESGEFDGTPYEIVMRNLRGNHVALVPKGRAGADVVVADEAPDAPPLRSFAAWMRKNPLSLKDAQTQEWENTKAAMDDAWITVQSNGGGRHVLLGDDGTIKAGMGGKFNGQRIDLIPRKPKAPPDANAVVKLPSSRYNIPKLTGGSGGNMEEKGEGFKKIPPAVSAYIKDVLGDSEAEMLTAIENNPHDVIDELQNQLNNLNWNERMLRNAGKTEKADKAKQEREQFQEYVDKLRGTSPDTTREYMQKLVDLTEHTTKSKERIMSAFEVRQKNYPIPDNQERVGFPPKVVGETDKAYEVREANPFASPFKNVVNEYLPKSRVTMKDGHVIGVEGWLKKKIDIEID